jgi:type I restriction enzyme S subunit
MAILAMEACCNQGCFLLTPKHGNNPRFLYYLLISRVDYLQALGRGSTFMELATDDLKALPLQVPTPERQGAIADYLDREGAKLDAMLAAKRQLLDLLAEKRRALITHAVTSGLNPNARLRDSDIEWLGKIPAHWETLHLKRVLASSTYGVSVTAGPDGAIPMLRMGDIMEGEIDYSRLAYIEEVDESLLLQPDDLLFNRTNSLDQIGKVGIIRATGVFPITFASYLVRLRASARVLPHYLSYLLNSSYALSWARAEAIPAIGQANLNPFRYGYLRFPLPPLNEQQSIVDFLTTQTKRFDALRTVTEQSILLLRERRLALIAAAVTGEIDVEAAA